jgi:two-component system, NtrC family, sensor kinase
MRLANRLTLSFAGAVNTAVRRARGFATFAGETVRQGVRVGRLRGAPATNIDADRPPQHARIRGWRRGVVDNKAGAIRPRRGLTWPLRSLLGASLAVPLLLLAVAAWQNFRLVKVQAEQQVMIEAGQLHEHAFRAIETYALVLAWIDDRIHGLDWDRIEHDDGLHRFLLDLETLPQIGGVSIIDGAGRLRASGRFFPAPPADASDRDAFAAHKQQDAGIFVGHEKPDPLTSEPYFDISRRRSTSDASFDGVIVVSARPQYFSDFFSTVSRNENFSALLVRSDGSVLVRFPPLHGPLVFSSDRPIMQAIARNPDRGLFWGRGGTDGIERLFGYQRIEGYPLYVAFGIPTRGVLAAWRANLVDYLLFAVPASLGLFCMTLFAVRQLQQQKVATWRWQTTAQRLKREMNRRTRAETELHQAQKMEALGQLTGGVAHDFNNLLTVLQGCLEMLNGRQRDERLQARVEMALGTIERGEKLTGQLLAFARRQPLTIERVDVNGLLRRMAELLARTVGSGINVATDLAPGLWSVDADATQLELAVINLAINARDAMPSGGVLRVRTFNAKLPPQTPEAEPGEGTRVVGLEISDTGTGMPPEVLARAFEPFFTTKGPGKGTGLGLSMVYGFARQSGGSATIRSEIGRGTAVILLLPKSDEPQRSDNNGATDLPADRTA